MGIATTTPDEVSLGVGGPWRKTPRGDPQPAAGGGSSCLIHWSPPSIVAYTTAWSPEVVWPIQPALRSRNQIHVFNPSPSRPWLAGGRSVLSTCDQLAPPSVVRNRTAS